MPKRQQNRDDTRGNEACLILYLLSDLEILSHRLFANFPPHLRCPIKGDENPSSLPV